jgi:RNA polymerase-binding transcription factor DksA
MDLQAQRRRLLALLKEAGETGPSDEDSKESLRDYSHELSVFDNHPADVATEDYMRNLDAALRENDAQIVEKIQRAIARLDRGEYQVCSICGKKIAAARLRALPYAETCELCAQEQGEELGGLGKSATVPRHGGDSTWPRFYQYGTSDSIQDQPRQVRDDVKPD